MFRVSGWIAAAGLTVVVAVPAHGDEASKRAKLHELFLAMHMDKTIDIVTEQAADQGVKGAMSMFPQTNLTAEQQKVLDGGIAQIRMITHDGLSWAKLEPGITDVYAESYSEPTIDGLLAFYKSPAGQEMVAKQGEVMTRASVAVQKAAVDMRPKMEKVMQDMMANPVFTPVKPK